MDWWKHASHSQLCASSKELVDEWIRLAKPVSVICGHGSSTASATRPTLLEFQKHCDNEQVADFAWLTLRVAHAFTCYNNTNARSIDTDAGWDEVAVWVKCTITVLFFIVFVVGLIGNFFTALVIYYTPALHSHTNYFLASLAASDFFLMIFGVPYDVAYLWKRSAPPSLPGYCKITSVTINFFTLASILTIVALTAERFFAICYPFSLLCLDRRRVINIIYGLWIIALIPSLYIGLQYKQVIPDFCGIKRALNDGTGICDYVNDVMFPFNVTFETTLAITFALPVSFIIFCYVRILKALSEMSHVANTRLSSNSSAPIEGFVAGTQRQHPQLYMHTKSNEPPRSQQAQKVVIKMLVLATAVFFMCYLPYHVERLIVHYKRKQCDESRLCQMLYPITGLLLYVSAMLNPIFYSVMSVRFREAFSSLIKATFSKERYMSVILA